MVTKAASDDAVAESQHEFIELRQEITTLERGDSAALRSELEKIKAETDALREIISEEVTRVHGGIRLDISLDKARVKDEAAIISKEIVVANDQIDAEIKKLEERMIKIDQDLRASLSSFIGAAFIFFVVYKVHITNDAMSSARNVLPAPSKRKHHISYNKVHRLVGESVEKFNLATDFKPDILVAIGGGGFLPARIMRTYLKTSLHKNVPIQAIGLALYASTPDSPDAEAPLPEVTKTQWLDYHSNTDLNSIGAVDGCKDSNGSSMNGNYTSSDNPLKQSTVTSLIGKNVLIVDEVDDTRRTLGFAVQELRKDADMQKERWEAVHPGLRAPPTRIGVFVLHNKIKHKEGVLPDEIMHGNYFAAEEQEDVWLAYPWDALDIDTHTERALAEEAEETATMASTRSNGSGLHVPLVFPLCCESEL
ncbi:hypothetical protein SeMB42_g01993 [Synchytrium endobioticum]|uniref:Phosphoribosyltransferase domain-containing protein n=1 Tax=Synchytrium endobioticum TaxID=286115 RepID=A0A507DJ34_9FUNG|nr:hypothetical protein SeMB42_g01993 [Synchytrium endobioticum]